MTQTGPDIRNPEGANLAELLTACTKVEPASVGLLEDVEATAKVDAPASIGTDPAVVTTGILCNLDLDALLCGALHNLIQHL